MSASPAPEGKTRSSQNASKHGLTAREVVISPGEQEEFASMRADLQAEIQPQGALQQIRPAPRLRQ